jgi:hypothetical protein
MDREGRSRADGVLRRRHARARAGRERLEGQVLYEKGQILVLSACKSREDFIPHRERVAAFVERMGEALERDAVFVLAFPSDSLLIELPMPPSQETSDE